MADVRAEQRSVLILSAQVLAIAAAKLHRLGSGGCGDTATHEA
jgi:hypothetical protein